MDGGLLILGTTGGGTPLPFMNGPYLITGGTIRYSNNSPTAQTIRSKTYQNIEITGTSVKNSDGNITLNARGTFTVRTGGIFEINANSITCPNGDGSVSVENGAVFKTGNNKGFNGFATSSLTYSAIHANIKDILLDPASTIEYKGTDQPITNSNGLVYGNLLLSGSGQKTASPDPLFIEGDFVKTGTGTFLHNNGLVVFNGRNAQAFSSNSPIQFYSVTNNNTSGLSINSDMEIYKELSLGENSTLVLNTGTIHLKSDQNNTANVAPIPANASITYHSGRFFVERYIPNHPKSWQFLSAPVKGSTVKDSWQEGNEPGENKKPGFGTQITSNLPGATSLGFDMSSASPSMKTYNSVTNQWEGIADTKNLLIENQKGYMIFIRGDRSVTGVNQASTATTLRASGRLYAPNEEVPKMIQIPANSFTSIGNPYASSIDFEKLVLSGGVESAYYIWDSRLTTSGKSAYGYGAYRTVSGNAVVPADGIYADGNIIPKIQSGQAFFVHATEPGTLSFSESCKTNSSVSLFRTTDEFTKPVAQLRANLYAILENERILIDGTLTQFDASYSNHLDNLDAPKIINSGENMSIISANTKLSIERRQMGLSNDTLSYCLEQLQFRDYILQFTGSRLEQYGKEALLKDNYSGTTIPISLSEPTEIHFSVNSSNATSLKDRFRVVFHAASAPLSLNFILLKASRRNNSILVEWKVENEKDISHYIIEKSDDGKRFILFKEVQANGSSYSHTDNSPFAGSNYYRIKSVINGKETFSEIVRINLPERESKISVYSTVLKKGIAILEFTNQPAGTYRLYLFNSSGQQIFIKEIIHPGGTAMHSISMSNPAKGIYPLKIHCPDGNQKVMRVSF